MVTPFTTKLRKVMNNLVEIRGMKLELWEARMCFTFKRGVPLVRYFVRGGVHFFYPFAEQQTVCGMIWFGEYPKKTTPLRTCCRVLHKYTGTCWIVFKVHMVMVQGSSACMTTLIVNSTCKKPKLAHSYWYAWMPRNNGSLLVEQIAHLLGVVGLSREQ